MSVFTNLPGGGCSYQGHVSNCHVDVSRWLRKLPPKPDEAGIVLVKRRTRGAMGGSARPPFRIRPYVIYQAILRLREAQRGIPNSYGDIELDEEVLREYYGWSPDIDPEAEHEISPRELEVECEADAAPPVDYETFTAWTGHTDFRYATEILRLARRTAPAVAPWDGIRRAIAEKAAEKRAEQEEEKEGSCSENEEEGHDETAGMLKARNTTLIPIKWLAALFSEEDANGGAGINEPIGACPDTFAEIAQELEVVRCLNAAAPSDEATYHWAEPERQQQDEGAKEQMAEHLIQKAQEPGFCNLKESQPPNASPPANEGGFAHTPPASFASFRGGPGAPPAQHKDPEYRHRERISQAEATKLVSEETPGYIRCGFPKIYQAGRGCPTERNGWAEAATIPPDKKI